MLPSPRNLPVEYTDPDLFDLIKEKNILYAEYTEINSKFRAVDNSIFRMVKDLNSKSLDIIDRLNKYQEEIYDALQELSKKTSSREETGFDYQEKREISRAEKIKTRSSVKELTILYRKISAKSHPDKVEEKWKIELFMEAAKAYAREDLSSLREIWGILSSPQSRGERQTRPEFSMKLSLMTEIKELNAKTQSIRNNLSNLKRSEIYGLNLLYKQSQIAALREYRQNLQVQEQMLLNQLRALKPSKYPPQYITIIYT